jgi:hypothetical protein
MAQIEIVPVEGLLRFTTFCKLPRLLYRGMSGFVAPIDAERWTLFSHRLNPHYKLVEEQKFLARRDGEWVGRIAAHLYKDMVPVGASPAQFGALDAIDDIEVVRALVSAAEEWLRARGAERMNGPFSPSINSECGLLVEGHEATPMFLMPWHPAYLGRHLDALGYEKARDLISYRWDDSDRKPEEKPRFSLRKEWAERLKVRTLDMSRLKTHETPIMADLFNDAWSGNWGYVPFTQEEFDSTADGLKFIMPADYGLVIELDGKPQSFVVALPNFCEIIADLDGRLFPFGWVRLLSRMRSHSFISTRIALLGTRKALQNSATGGLILMTIVEEARRRAATSSGSHLEAGWVLEDNKSMRRPIEMFGGKVDKIHRIYEKRLMTPDNFSMREGDSVDGIAASQDLGS